MQCLRRTQQVQLFTKCCRCTILERANWLQVGARLVERVLDLDYLLPCFGLVVLLVVCLFQAVNFLPQDFESAEVTLENVSYGAHRWHHNVLFGRNAHIILAHAWRVIRFLKRRVQLIKVFHIDFEASNFDLLRRGTQLLECLGHTQHFNVYRCGWLADFN